jgi:hypothetical protein
VKGPLALQPHSPQAQRSAPERKAHPLLSAFPLAVMAIGTLLVVFALTMTWLNANDDSALHTSRSASPVAMSSAHTP